MRMHKLTRRIALAAALALLASGCAAQIREHEVTTCAGYGFQAGTESFANCLMTVDQARLNRARTGTIFLYSQ